MLVIAAGLTASGTPGSQLAQSSPVLGAGMRLPGCYSRGNRILWPSHVLRGQGGRDKGRTEAEACRRWSQLCTRAGRWGRPQGMGEVGLLPFWGQCHLGWAVQVLLEAQLEGLADGADDALGQALTALQDVAGCGDVGHAASKPHGRAPATGPPPASPGSLTSLVDGVLGDVGHVIRHVLGAGRGQLDLPQPRTGIPSHPPQQCRQMGQWMWTQGT